MKIRTALVLGVVAFAGLLAAAVLVTRPGRTGSARAPDASAVATPDGAITPAPAANAGTAVAVPTELDVSKPTPEPMPPEVMPPVPNGRRSAAAHVAWDSVPIAARAGQLGPDVSGAVVIGLRSARAQMDSCFQDEATLLASGGGPRFDPSDPPSGPGSLTLLLQSRPGGVDVVGTEIVSQGTSSAQLVACVRHVLDGWVIAAPKATGGRRYRLRYAIQ